MSDPGRGVPLSVSAFIRSAIGEGMGVTAARAALREEGVGRMSNAAFGQLYGQIRAAVGDRSAIAGMDYTQPVPTSVMTPWAAGTPDRYASFVEVYVRPIGSRDVTSKWHTYVTDFPHSGQEAIDAAVEQIMGGSETGMTPSGEVIVGAAVTSTTRTVARAS